MKIGEIINESQPIVLNINIGTPSGQPEVNMVSGDQETAADGVMIPPLQQKLELVKKLAGEESAYDPVCDDCGQTPCECEQEDELSVLRRNAGISGILAHLADEDEPYEG